MRDREGDRWLYLSGTEIVQSLAVSEIELVKGRKQMELMLGLGDGLKED
jgi:hypothetical protein